MNASTTSLSHFSSLLDARKHGAFLRGQMASRGYRHIEDSSFTEKDREALRAFTMADQGYLTRNSPELAAFNCGYGNH